MTYNMLSGTLNLYTATTITSLPSPCLWPPLNAALLAAACKCVTLLCCVAGPEVHERLRTLNKCPLQQARWCIISDYEMMKCEKMIMAFAAKNLKPDLNCVRGSSVQDCMWKIQTGDADLITLDAADIYTAGRLVSCWRRYLTVINYRRESIESRARDGTLLSVCHTMSCYYNIASG